VPPSVRAIDQLEKERIREEKERIKAEKLNKKQMEKHGGLLETQEGDKERKNKPQNDKEEKSKRPSDSED